jgi:hypothetical protein
VINNIPTTKYIAKIKNFFNIHAYKLFAIVAGSKLELDHIIQEVHQ